jgi:hypothetical protein
MKILTKIYWIRVGLGVVSGLISTSIPFIIESAGGDTVRNQISQLNTLLNGITVALLVYLLSFYVLRSKFSSQVEKASKIMSMGIFIYFFAWLVTWVLTLTLILGPPLIPAT